jgi:hypothetical protein
MKPSNENGFDTRSAEQILQEFVEQDRFPTLAKLLAEHEDQENMRDELLALIRMFVPERAPRQNVKVVGKLMRRVAGVEVEEAVVVRDISKTGVQLAISNHLGLSASDLTEVKLRLRLPTGQDTVAMARLVRVVRSDEHFIQGGFRFTQIDDRVARELGNLKSVQSARAAEILEERRSLAAPPEDATEQSV